MHVSVSIVGVKAQLDAQCAGEVAFLQAVQAIQADIQRIQLGTPGVVAQQLVERLLERGQLLAESPSRPALQAFLPQWREAIAGLKAPSKLRWHIEVDPLEF